MRAHRQRRYPAVLLRGVNSSARIMKELMHELVKNRVRPYYIYQCDLEDGLEHFRTPVEKGIEIMEELRGWTTGFAVPTFVIDAPGGGGKIPIAPNYLLALGESRVSIRNFEGSSFSYPQPVQRDCSVQYEAKWYGEAAPAVEPHAASASESKPRAKLRVLRAASA
jgi:lysine 2,3-aminomutase